MADFHLSPGQFDLARLEKRANNPRSTAARSRFLENGSQLLIARP
jgi:hypothetical protein